MMMTKNIKGRKDLFRMMLLSIFVMFSVSVAAQENPEAAMKAAKKYMQEAEAALADEDVATAEAFYRKAIAKDPSNAAARYNLGNLYYNKEITGEAVERHGQAAAVAENKALKHDSFHNRGNAFMKQKKYKEAVEAYKNSLRNNPTDDETRYNLALAKKLLEEEEKKGGGQDNKEKNKDQQNKDQKDQKDQEGDKGEKEQKEEGKPDENKEGGEKDQKDPKEGEDKKDQKGKPQNQDKKNQKDKQGEQKPQQQQPRPGQLSPQQVKNLLEAMGNEEKKVQEKINAEKVKGVPVKTEKDW